MKKRGVKKPVLGVNNPARKHQRPFRQNFNYGFWVTFAAVPTGGEPGGGWPVVAREKGHVRKKNFVPSLQIGPLVPRQQHRRPASTANVQQFLVWCAFCHSQSPLAVLLRCAFSVHFVHVLYLPFYSPFSMRKKASHTSVLFSHASSVNDRKLFRVLLLFSFNVSYICRHPLSLSLLLQIARLGIRVGIIRSCFCGNLRV